MTEGERRSPFQDKADAELQAQQARKERDSALRGSIGEGDNLSLDALHKIYGSTRLPSMQQQLREVLEAGPPASSFRETHDVRATIQYRARFATGSSE